MTIKAVGLFSLKKMKERQKESKPSKISKFPSWTNIHAFSNYLLSQNLCRHNSGNAKSARGPGRVAELVRAFPDTPSREFDPGQDTSKNTPKDAQVVEQQTDVSL